MKIVDCPWEVQNLGCRTAEVELSADVRDWSPLAGVERSYDYVVVKVPPGCFPLHAALRQRGYTFVESLMTVRRSLAAQPVATPGFEVECVPVAEALSPGFLETLIPTGMFATDRIALDPLFGPASSARRYRNWLAGELGRGAVLLRLVRQSVPFGFLLLKAVGDVLQVVLHGIFPAFQGQGLGHSLLLAPQLYRERFAPQLTTYETSFSSNNPAIVRVLTSAGCAVVRTRYVFIKHSRQFSETDENTIQ